MPVYHDYKLIHVHIPRSGGTSIQKELFEDFDGQKVYVGTKPVDLYGISGGKVLQHLTCNEMLRENYVSIKMFDNYFKFTVVRNPYYRIISQYLWSIEDKNATSFHDYIVNIVDNFASYGGVIRFPFNKQSEFQILHLRPQWKFIYNDNRNDNNINTCPKLLVDKVIRMENYEEEVNKFLEEHCDKKTPASKQHKCNYGKTIKNMYTSNELLDIVNKYYKKDFELLDYPMFTSIDDIPNDL